MQTTKREMLQARRIETLKRRLKKAEEDNKALKQANEDLQDKLRMCEEKLTIMSGAEREFREAIANAKDIRDKYEKALSDLKNIRSKYVSEAKRLIHDLK